MQAWRADLGDPTGHDLDLAKTFARSWLAVTDERANGPDHPVVAIRVNNLGRVLHDQGDLAAARTHLEEALAIFADLLPIDYPDVQRVRNELSRLP